MYIIQKRPGDQIKLGRKGEYNARRIALDLSAWQTRYGDNGTVQLLYQRPGEATPYPVALTREDHLALCPVCGEKSWVHIWYTSAQTVFYGTFHCQTHGTFPARLTLGQAEDGTWRGRLAVPAVTPDLLAAFDKARNKSSYPYRATGRRKRKRRWIAHQAAMRRKQKSVNS